MKTNIIKGGKRALGLLLAVCVLAVSLFTANVGISINTDAATTEKTPYVWSGNVADSIADASVSTGTADDPIEIASPEELAYLVGGAGGTTEGLYYKIKEPNAIYDLSGMSGITLDSTLDNVKIATKNKEWTIWGKTEVNTAANQFKGIFDGNGLIVYNMYAEDVGSALFPYVNTSSNCTVTIKNITIKNSRFETPSHSSATYAGAVIGQLNGANNVVLDAIAVENCHYEGFDSDGATGILIGSAAWAASSLQISNCFINNISFMPYSGDDATCTQGGLLGNAGNSRVVKSISNVISIGISPVNNNNRADNFSNVYTNQTSSTTGVSTLNTSQMTGSAATENMALDFSGTWFANTTTYPVLRAFHNLTAKNNGDGTHSEECSDCDIVGVPANHYYNTVDAVNNITLCSCGAAIDGIFDVWDSQGAIDSEFEGKGTAEEPYIIMTVEELYGMVRSSGVDANGNALYYKVADGVSALYINDTRGYTSQTAFEEAAAAGSLKNWSYGLLTDSERCSQSGNCGASHYNTYTYTFSGYFDGNGVTIYGLYSETEAAKSSYWAPGTGFVPGLADNGTIMNAVFDMSYVKNSEGYASVITSSFGAWTGRYTNGLCADITFKVPGDATPVIKNVAIRNAYVNTTYSPELTDNGYVAGFIAAHMQPKGFKMQNCLFDGNTSTLISSATNKYYSGMYSAPTGNTYNEQISDCVVVDTANNYDIAYLGGTFDDTYDFIHNSYAYGVTSTYGTLNTTDYTTVDGMPMLNWTAWDNSEETIAQYGTPMPKLVDGWEALGYRYYKDAYKNSNWYDNLPYGHSASVNGAGYEQGVFSEYDELVGAGTVADPYIIDNAQLLFEIIASGGTHRGVPQYFKLGCDVDLGGIQWVNYQTNADRNDTYGISYYAYKPFAGTIDGDGHTVTGMFTATADTNAGFIPELTATGVVKNLHFRDCYAYTSSGNYGIIAGTVASGSQIIGCSIENSENAKIVGSNAATITNSYITVDGSTTYYLDSGSTGTPTVDGVTWYQGGADGSAPKLVNRADAMPYADADGDGDGYEYGTRDLAALKSKLLRAPDYANIYGDVSRNGKTDIRDMVILQREIIAMSASDPTAEWKILDGFWKNVKAGKFSIYYDENDNYDFARKMELYIEETTGVDILKTKGTTTANLTIRIVTDDTLGANNYSVSYDLETATLTISGGSFTAVEQGVLNFIANSNALNGTVYTGSGSLAPEKQAINVQTYSTSNENGSLTNSSSIVDKGTYYYVWGDEFNTAVNGTVLYDTWIVRDKGHGNGSNDFTNLYLANADDLPKLNVVSGGKLTMHRGVGSLAPTSGTLSGSTEDNGAYISFDGNSMSSSGVLTSKNSMLFKRGYIEMQAILPNDDYAFPAWWLLTNAGNNNLEVSSSLYSKVYERNSGFDGNSLYYSSDDYTTYEYKLPTSHFEIDLFEIINNPNGSGKRDTIFYNIHKWYLYSKTYEGSTKGFSVYELDWDALEDGTISDFDEGTKLLDATYNSGTYSISNAAIKYHASNAESGQINVAINEFGTDTASGTTYGKFDDTELTWEDIFAGILKKEPFDVNMVTSIGDSTTVTEYRYGFLWTEDEMTFIIKDTSDNLLSSVTVNCADLGYDGGSVMAEQYAYFLIDNHYYTKDGAKISSDMPMTIEYVRLYQLDGARDIVTPETEAFNSNTRW